MPEQFFAETLVHWHLHFDNRLLPWGEETDPYRIWLREIILQQTRVEQGKDYYFRFTHRFPTINTLADADEDEIFKLWEGLGYYTRCRNLIATARTVVQKYNGEFPADYHELLRLKGIGPYTAAAIASFAYNLPWAVVDGNVKRVLARYFGIQLPVDSAGGKKKVTSLAQKLICKKSPAQYNQAIMNFGATVCKPAKPDCERCPLNEKCFAYQHDLVAELPVKSGKVQLKTRFFNYLVLQQSGRLFIRQRTGKDIWQKLYEFPLIESGHLLKEHELQSPYVFKDATKQFSVGRISGPYRQQLTHQKIIVQFVQLDCDQELPLFMDATPRTIAEIRDLAFPKVIRSFLEQQI